jgi:hypothetical protein
MACYTLLANKPDGQPTYLQHAYHNRSHNPHAKHCRSRCPPQSEATQRPPNSLETHVASPTQPSPATYPQSAINYSRHRQYTQPTNSSQLPNTDTGTKRQHQLQNYHPLSKLSYMSSTPYNRPHRGWKTRKQTPLPSHPWTWTTILSVSNPRPALSTSPTLRAPPHQPGTSSAPPPPL